jgi:transposase
MTEYQQKQLRKSIYIPKCCRGEISNFEAAQKIGIAKVNVLKLKKRYREKGELAFIRANKGHKPYNQKYDSEFENHIIYLHDTYYKDTPYRAFWRCLRDIEKISIPYNSLRNICKRKVLRAVRNIRHIKSLSMNQD